MRKKQTQQQKQEAPKASKNSLKVFDFFSSTELIFCLIFLGLVAKRQRIETLPHGLFLNLAQLTKSYIFKHYKLFESVLF